MSKTYEFPGLPLGMGATLGSFIRRSLYCQRKKWDIIGFRLNQLHEFNTIPNSTDMVTDLLPKFKDLSFTLKPELTEVLSKNLGGENSGGFNLEQYADSVVIFNTMNSEKSDQRAIVAISMFIDDTSLTSDAFSRWFNVRTPITFCRMISPTKLNLTLYLMEVQGTMSQEESYACITSAGIGSAGYVGNYEGADDIIYLPGSNRGDLTVVTTYREELDHDVLEVTISPDNSETRAIVVETVMAAIRSIADIVRVLSAG